MRRLFILTVLSLFIAGIYSRAAVIMRGDRLTLSDSSIVARDLYMFGRKAEINGSVGGDLTACAQKVQLNGLVQQNFYCSAQLIELNGEVGSDFIGLAQDIIIDGKVHGGFRGGCAAFTLNDTIWGDVVIGAGDVDVAPNAVIYGDLYAGAGEIDLQGLVNGNVIAYAQDFSLAGKVTGNVKITVEEVEFKDGAHIGGNFSYKRSKELKEDLSPYVAGKIVFTKLVEEGSKTCEWLCGLWFFLGSVLIVILICALFPQWMDKGSAFLTDQAWKTLGLGFISFIVLPVVSIIALVTVIGIPLGIILLLLYGIWLYLGWLTAAVILGNWGLKIAGWDKAGWILNGIIGLIVLYVLGMIPVAGCLINFCALIFGLGLVLMLLYQAFWGTKTG